MQMKTMMSYLVSSVDQSCLTLCNPHGLQYARLHIYFPDVYIYVYIYTRVCMYITDSLCGINLKLTHIVEQNYTLIKIFLN